jgi:hypothetical protein
MNRWAVVTLLCAGFACVANAGTADGRALPRFHYAATAADTPVSDGARYLAFAVSDTATRVVDTKLGHSIDLETPVGSLPASIGDPHCRLQTMNAGRILWSCPAISHGQPNQLVEDVRSGRFLPTPGLSDLSSGEASGTAFTRLGGHWLAGWKEVPQSLGPGLFYNLETGNVRFGAGVNRYGDHHVEDPSWPSLMHPLCTSLRRPRYRTVIPGRGGFDTVVTIYGRFEYQPPYALAWPIEAYQAGDMSIYRCGVRRPVRLDRCADWGSCTQVVLGARRVTWQSLLGVRAYDAVAKRSYTWPTDEIGLRWPSQFFVLTHTASRIFIVYATSLNSSGGATSWTIRAAPWPAS